MPVSAQETLFQHIGNGVTVSFPYGCQVAQPSDLKVYINDVEVTSGFAISGIGGATGGSVTFDSPPPPSTQVRLERDIVLERFTEYQQNGDFLARVVNPDFNRIWMALQQHLSALNRTLQTPKSDATQPALLPTSADRADKLLGFDAAGNPIAVVPTAQSAAAMASELAKNIGASLIGFSQAGAAAVFRSVQSKLRERISIADYGNGTGQGDAAKDTAAILAAVAAVKQAFYDKGSACLHYPTPAIPYRLTETIDLAEVWNLTISTDSGFFFQRFAGPVDPTADLGLIQWYGPEGGTMIRLHYTFGFASRSVSFNGRGIAKLGIDVAPSSSVASVTRKVDFIDLLVKNCDFGMRIGDLQAQTDNAPVTLTRPYFEGCKSAGLLVSSGNAAVNIDSPWFINNGYAPSTGNSFISDVDNIGAHMAVLAGFVGVTNWTSDHDGGHLLQGAAIYQTNGSLRVNGGWADDPTKPFYRGSADRAIYFNGVTHYDAGMTLESTPTSIVYSGPQPLVLEGCYLYGNVEIKPGNQASVIDHGTVFARPGAGFTGDMVGLYGGLSRTGKTGNNSLASSIGGDFPKDIGGHHSHTVWSDQNRTGLVRAVRNGGYKITEHINSANAQMFMLGNAWFDADVGQYKAIKPGACWRHSYSKNTEIFEAYQASASGQVISWGSAHGFLPGVGANAISILTLGGQKLTWDSAAPTTGTWNKGDECLSLNATTGQPKSWKCTVAGAPGTWVSTGNL